MDSHDKTIERDGLVRFRVPLERGHVEAYLSHATCQAAGRPHGGKLSLSDFVRAHRPALDEIVAGKVRAGARVPVVVMAHDL